MSDTAGLRIAVILGSTRPGRNGEAVAFVGHGVLGAVRAIEHLRGIAGELERWSRALKSVRAPEEATV